MLSRERLSVTFPKNQGKREAGKPCCKGIPGGFFGKERKT
jgi:hypothetical protein